MTSQMLDLTSIRIDGDTQPRVSIDQQVVADYAAAMERGDTFPPVEVVCDGAAYWLVDGFHRYLAHRKLERPQIAAVMTTGVLADAQWLSLTANKTHGLRRTNEDKAKAVTKALRLRPGHADREIALHVGVHFNTVTKYREALERAATITNCDSRTGRDGRTIRTGSIGRGAKARSQPVRSSKIFTPIREGSKPLPMTALSMPHDPVMGARTLIELFKPDYLRALVAHLTQHLEGATHENG